MQSVKRVTTGGGKSGGLQVRVLIVTGTAARLSRLQQHQASFGYRKPFDESASKPVAPHLQDMINTVTDENSPGASPQLLSRIVDYINRSPDK